MSGVLRRQLVVALGAAPLVSALPGCVGLGEAPAHVYYELDDTAAPARPARAGGGRRRARAHAAGRGERGERLLRQHRPGLQPLGRRPRVLPARQLDRAAGGSHRPPARTSARGQRRLRRRRVGDRRSPRRLAARVAARAAVPRRRDAARRCAHRVDRRADRLGRASHDRPPALRAGRAAGKRVGCAGRGRLRARAGAAARRRAGLGARAGRPTRGLIRLSGASRRPSATAGNPSRRFEIVRATRGRRRGQSEPRPRLSNAGMS